MKKKLRLGQIKSKLKLTEIGETKLCTVWYNKLYQKKKFEKTWFSLITKKIEDTNGSSAKTRDERRINKSLKGGGKRNWSDERKPRASTLRRRRRSTSMNKRRSRWLCRRAHRPIESCRVARKKIIRLNWCDEVGSFRGVSSGFLTRLRLISPRCHELETRDSLVWAKKRETIQYNFLAILLSAISLSMVLLTQRTDKTGLGTKLHLLCLMRRLKGHLMGALTHVLPGFYRVFVRVITSLGASHRWATKRSRRLGVELFIEGLNWWCNKFHVPQEGRWAAF